VTGVRASVVAVSFAAVGLTVLTVTVTVELAVLPRVSATWYLTVPAVPVNYAAGVKTILPLTTL